MDWSQVLTIALAAYGALLSSGLAIVQVHSYWSRRRNLVVEVTRYSDFSEEIFEFRLVNRSGHSTEIQEITLHQYGIGEEGGFQAIAGRTIDAYKSSFGRFVVGKAPKIDLPFALEPGQGVWIFVDGTAIGECFRPVLKETFGLDVMYVRSDLFAIHIQHSQRAQRLKAFFEINEVCLDPEHQIVGWQKLVPVWKRSAYRIRSRKRGSTLVSLMKDSKK